MSGGEPLIEIIVNCPTSDCADRVAEALMAAKIVAAVNIYPPIRSRYVWQGEPVSREEIPVLAKTRAALFDAAATVIRRAHDYGTPSITGKHIDRVEETYRQWVIEATTP